MVINAKSCVGEKGLVEMYLSLDGRALINAHGLRFQEKQA